MVQLKRIISLENFVYFSEHISDIGQTKGFKMSKDINDPKIKGMRVNGKSYLWGKGNGNVKRKGDIEVYVLLLMSINIQNFECLFIRGLSCSFPMSMLILTYP